MLSQELFEGGPIFPLPGAVLFPGTALPLHVFEPRYRELMAYCIESSSPMVIAMIQPGHESDHLGAPPIVGVAGVGQLVGHQRLPDGRYHAMLQGIGRGVLEEQASERSFRMARVKMLDEVWPEARGEVVEKGDTIQALMSSLASAVPGISRLLSSVSLLELDAGVRVDLIASLIFEQASERQSLLETPEISRRHDRVIERLAALLAERATPPSGPLN